MQRRSLRTLGGADDADSRGLSFRLAAMRKTLRPNGNRNRAA